MISSIFGKTKPINFILVLLFLFLTYWVIHLVVFDKTYTSYELVVLLAYFAVLGFSIFVVDFIVKRNKITDPNTFAILFYAILILAFPETLTDSNAIFCSFFVLLATRRLISIRSLKNIKFKIFDATFWIMISSLFYQWAVLYVFLVLMAIYIYEPKNIRNWLVPIAAIFTAFMISFCALILANNVDFFANHYHYTFEFNTDYFLEWSNSTKLLVYILLTTFTIIFAFLKLGKAGLGQIVTMRLIGFSFILGLILKVVTSSNDVYPIMLTFFPASVFITNYVEAIKKDNIKEIVLIASVCTPLLLLVITVLIK